MRRTTPVLFAATSAVALMSLSACSSAGPVVADPTTATSTSMNPASSSTTSVDTDPASGGPGRSRVLFTEFSGCGEFLDAVKAAALQRVTPYGLDGQYGIMYSEDRAAGTAPMTTAAAAATTMAPSAAPSAEKGTSGTNTQEVGVDEGDQAETDGRYVYAMLDSRVLRILDTETSTQVGSITVDPDSWGHQLILDGRRLAIVSQAGNGNEVRVALYDVAQPADPVLVSRSRMEGQLVSVRSIDHRARIVLRSTFGDRLPFVHPTITGDEDKALATNTSVINGSNAQDWIPRIVNSAPTGSSSGVRQALECNRIGTPTDPSGLGLSWVASVDLLGGEPVTGSAGVIATGETVYASTDTLYVATIRSGFDSGVVQRNKPLPLTTAVHAFDLHDIGGARYVGSGQVPGALLNSYSMSEFGGDLRIATTGDGSDFSIGQESSVFVLRRTGSDLEQIGSVSGLGRGEQIQAVRFLGDLGYVVTFRRVDPLYVIDLRDPTKPVVAGELKVPGYSSYLHPVGPGLLLGIGQDATTDGRVKGSKLSLFDVTDPAAPVERSVIGIGTQSEAEFDPHAFLYWDESGTAVIPTGAWLTEWRGGAVVVDVADGALRERGRIRAHGDSPDPIRRTMIVGGKLVALSNSGLSVRDLSSLQETGWIPFV